MQYERCTSKKLRALFDFLDTDHDGIINFNNLQNGLDQLQQVDPSFLPNTSISCEYNSEEILRCLPKYVFFSSIPFFFLYLTTSFLFVYRADDHGHITLKTFLESEATLLPELTRLKLLT